MSKKKSNAEERKKEHKQPWQERQATVQDIKGCPELVAELQRTRWNVTATVIPPSRCALS